MNAILFLVAVAVMALAVVVLSQVKQVNKLYDVIAKQAMKISDHETIILAHDEKIKRLDYQADELEKALAEFPVEDIRAQAEAEKAWNEGVQNVLNFGLDTMKKGGNE